MWRCGRGGRARSDVHGGSGRGLGHFYVIDGQIDAMPDFDPMLPDRLIYIDLQVWLLSVGCERERDDMPKWLSAFSARTG